MPVIRVPLPPPRKLNQTVQQPQIPVAAPSIIPATPPPPRQGGCGCGRRR